MLANDDYRTLCNPSNKLSVCEWKVQWVSQGISEVVSTVQTWRLEVDLVCLWVNRLTRLIRSCGFKRQGRWREKSRHSLPACQTTIHVLYTSRLYNTTAGFLHWPNTDKRKWIKPEPVRSTDQKLITANAINSEVWKCRRDVSADKMHRPLIHQNAEFFAMWP